MEQLLCEIIENGLMEKYYKTTDLVTSKKREEELWNLYVLSTELVLLEEQLELADNETPGWRYDKNGLGESLIYPAYKNRYHPKYAYYIFYEFNKDTNRYVVRFSGNDIRPKGSKKLSTGYYKTEKSAEKRMKNIVETCETWYDDYVKMLGAKLEKVKSDLRSQRIIPELLWSLYDDGGRKRYLAS